MIAELRGLAEPQDLVVDQTRRTNATLRGVDLVIQVGCVKRSETHQSGFVYSHGALRFAARTLQESQIHELASRLASRVSQ